MIRALFFLAGLVVAALPAYAQSTKPAGVKTTAVTDSLVICMGSCVLQSFYVTTGTTAGYVMLFKATTKPANGAVQPEDCIVAPAVQTTAIDYNTKSIQVNSSGLIAVFSTTGCYTLTASSTVQFMKGLKT